MVKWRFGLRTRRGYVLGFSTILFCMCLVYLLKSGQPKPRRIQALCTFDGRLLNVKYIFGLNQDYEEKSKHTETQGDKALCPEYPPELVGKLAMNASKERLGIYSEKAIKNVKSGGIFKPSDCIARESVAIIVPYRDREEQLHAFLEHMHTFLQRQKLEYTIYIVELSGQPKPRRIQALCTFDGRLLNVKYIFGLNQDYEEKSKHTETQGDKALCPEYPPELVGKLAMNASKERLGIYSEKAIKNVKSGGIFKPSDCIARESVAIIVPYRDREEQLHAFLEHMHTFLQRQKLEYTIYIVELALPAQFNRGVIANAGFLAATGIRKHTCFIVHDVDLLPANDLNLYTCSSAPRHLSVAINTFDYKLPYPENFGGVSAFSEKQFRNMNGYPNRYFGWGGEDDDAHDRVSAAGYVIERPAQNIGLYEAMKHKRDSHNPENPDRNALLGNAVKFACLDGIHKPLFTRKAIEFRPLYTWVYISASEVKISEIFE